MIFISDIDTFKLSLHFLSELCELRYIFQAPMLSCYNNPSIVRAARCLIMCLRVYKNIVKFEKRRQISSTRCLVIRSEIRHSMMCATRRIVFDLVHLWVANYTHVHSLVINNSTRSIFL